MANIQSEARLVQLDRMSAYGADGRRFESCTGCFSFYPPYTAYSAGKMDKTVHISKAACGD